MPNSESVYVLVNKDTFSITLFSNARATFKAVAWLTGKKFSTTDVVVMNNNLKDVPDHSLTITKHGTGRSDVVVSLRQVHKNFGG